MTLSHINALVTGAAGGIGSVLAAELLDEGAAVLLTDRRKDALEELAGTLSTRGGQIRCVVADITSHAGRSTLAESCATLGVNTLINLAGVNSFGLLDEQDASDIELAMTINTTSPILLCQRLIAQFSALPEAHIVNVGSMLGSIAMPGYSAYCASKSALHAFSQALRRELGDTNVRVHYVAPRATRTPLNDARICELNAKLGISMDAPIVVADAVIHSITRDKAESFVGFPERIYRIVNALLPGVIDQAIRKQLPIIRQYAAICGAAAPADIRPAPVTTN